MTVIDQGAPVELGHLAELSIWPRRKRPITRSVLPLMAACDLAAMAMAFLGGSAVRILLTGSFEGPARLSVSLLHEAPYALVFLATMGMYGLYGRVTRRVRPSWFLDFGQLVHSLAIGSVAVAALSSGLHRLAGAPKLGWVEVGAMAAPAVLLVPVLRGAGSIVARRGGNGRLRAAVVGSGPSTDRLLRRLQRVGHLDLVGLVTEGEEAGGHPLPVLGGAEDLLGICERYGLDRIFVNSGRSDAAHLDTIIRHLPPHVRVSIVPSFSDLLTWQSRVEELDGLTIMEVPPAQLGLVRRVAKRMLDLVLSTVALIVAAPVFLALAVALKVTSPGPVFFRQTRIGYQGKPFEIIKFRTMSAGADAVKPVLLDLNDVDGPVFKIRLDPRVTTIGRFLRRTSLDELPQLFNVFLGQMALVGPRPLVPEESACFDGWAARRFEVKPGMTGLWQVSGRSDLPFEELCQLDYAYAASWSLWWDLKILWQTPASILRGHGAY